MSHEINAVREQDVLTPINTTYNLDRLRLQLHGAIYRPDSFVLIPHHCLNLKATRYESTSLNRIAADKSHSVIAA